MRSYECLKDSASSPSKRRLYYLGLGSNLGDSAQQLVRAAEILTARGVRIRRRSSLYRSEPVGFSPQPWFTNQAIAVETALSPRELLKLAKSIEAELGRRPGRHFGPRPIDIDILLAQDVVLKTPELEIPHPRLQERNFVLIPLAEIAPRVLHPLLGKSILRLCRESSDRSRVSRILGSPAGPPETRARVSDRKSR